MREQQRIAIIAFIVLLSIAGLCFVVLNIFDFKTMLSNFFDLLFLMFLYAVIPCAPAVILRAVFGVRSLKWIAFAATVLGALCCMVHILLPESVLTERVILYEDVSVVVYDYINNWIFVVTQFALTSSVPVLYCVAFTGDLYRLPFVFRKDRSILVAFAPSLMFFLSLFIRHVMINGLLEAFEFILDQSILMLIISSIVFAGWALLVIFISRMIYKYITRMKTKNDLNEKEDI